MLIFLYFNIVSFISFITHSLIGIAQLVWGFSLEYNGSWLASGHILYYYCPKYTFSVDGRRFDCFTTDSNEGHHKAHNAHAQHDAVVPVVTELLRVR